MIGPGLRFDTIPERDGQTDRRTELLYHYRASGLTRDKKSASGGFFLASKCIKTVFGGAHGTPQTLTAYAYGLRLRLTAKIG